MELDEAIMIVLTALMVRNIYLQRTQGAHLQQAKPRLEFYDFALEWLKKVDHLQKIRTDLPIPSEELMEAIKRTRTLAFVAFVDEDKRNRINSHLENMEELLQTIKTEAAPSTKLHTILLLESKTGKTELYNRIFYLFDENKAFMKDLANLCTKEEPAWSQLVNKAKHYLKAAVDYLRN